MYIPNHIKETLAGGFDMGTYSVIVTALSRNYGVFHIDYGRDENDVPYGEIGLISPYPIQLTFPPMTWDSYFEPDHDLNEEEADFYRRMQEYYDAHVFPIVISDVTIPEEVSREFVSGINGTVDEDGGDDQQVEFSIHTYVGEPFVYHELILKCTFQEEPYKNLKIGNAPIADADSFETFIMWYLTKLISVQPRISTEEHLD